MEPTIKVKGKEVSNEEFNSLKESLKDDNSKKLKQISENEYTVLEKMKG